MCYNQWRREALCRLVKRSCWRPPTLSVLTPTAVPLSCLSVHDACDLLMWCESETSSHISHADAEDLYVAYYLAYTHIADSCTTRFEFVRCVVFACVVVHTVNLWYLCIRCPSFYMCLASNGSLDTIFIMLSYSHCESLSDECCLLPVLSDSDQANLTSTMCPPVGYYHLHPPCPFRLLGSEADTHFTIPPTYTIRPSQPSIKRSHQYSLQLLVLILQSVLGTCNFAVAGPVWKSLPANLRSASVSLPWAQLRTVYFALQK